MSSKDNPAGGPAKGQADRTMGLARVLQKAGYGTRSQVDTLVASGRVQVAGEIVTDPHIAVEPGTEVTVGGHLIEELRRRYYAFHKPPRVVCTRAEGPTRKLVSEFLPRDVPGLNPAGRLDGKTTGLMLVSNDGAWNNAVTDDATLEQEYRVQVEGEMSDMEISVITAGIHLPNMGVFRPVSVKIVERMASRTVILMVVREGKARQLRRMFTTLRHQITLLRRVRIGEIWLGDLGAGAVRPLSEREVASIGGNPGAVPDESQED